MIRNNFVCSLRKFIVAFVIGSYAIFILFVARRIYLRSTSQLYHDHNDFTIVGKNFQNRNEFTIDRNNVKEDEKVKNVENFKNFSTIWNKNEENLINLNQTGTGTGIVGSEPSGSLEFSNCNSRGTLAFNKELRSCECRNSWWGDSCEFPKSVSSYAVHQFNSLVLIRILFQF